MLNLRWQDELEKHTMLCGTVVIAEIFKADDGYIVYVYLYVGIQGVFYKGSLGWVQSCVQDIVHKCFDEFDLIDDKPIEALEDRSKLRASYKTLVETDQPFIRRDTSEGAVSKSNLKFAAELGVKFSSKKIGIRAYEISLKRVIE